MDRNSSSSLLKLILVVCVLTLLVGLGIYMNTSKSQDSAENVLSMVDEFINPQAASAAINWSIYPPEVLTLLGLPKTVQNPGSDMSNMDLRKFNAQTQAAMWARYMGQYKGMSVSQSMSTYYCNYFKKVAATAAKTSGGNYISGFGGTNRLYVTSTIVPDSALAHMIDVWEETRGVDVPNGTFITDPDLPIC